MSVEAFFEVYSGLDREGPGLAEDVHWALTHCITPKRVLDAACGSGADTLTLAKALPEAQIEAVEQHGPYVDRAKNRLKGHENHVTLYQGDMLDVTGPYDLIWCAGAVYFKGIGPALKAWAPHLSDTGVVAFSEPVLTRGATPAATAFWEGYPTKETADILKQVGDAGFTTLDTRLIQGAPWAFYYKSLQARVEVLRAQGPSPEVDAACQEAETEITRWTAAPDDIAYLLIVARP